MDEDEDYTPESPNPDASLYGAYDAMQGLTPDPEDRGFFDEDAKAYNEAYEFQVKYPSND